MANIDIGKVAPTPKGQWNSAATYEKLDIIINGTSTYIAKQNVPSGTSINNTEYWQLLVEKGDRGEQGNGINNIQKISTSDIIDTYRINFNDGNYFDYNVTNGRSLYLNFEVSTTTGELYVDFLEEN